MAAPIVVVLFFAATAFADGSSSAYINIDELDAISYKVDILNSPVIGGQQESSGPVMQIKSRYGQEYQCSLSEIPRFYYDESNRRGGGDTSTDPADFGLLLKPLETSPCLTKTKDWWTYEFCYGKHIKQYHIEDNKIASPVIVLGLYESEYNWQNESKADGNSRNRLQRYHSQYYVNGSTCDVTGTQRRSEVRFVCEDGSGDYIHHVDEPESCRYIVTIHTTKVCHHPYLRPPPNNEAQSIVCNPVLTSDQYEKYLKREEVKKAAIEEKRQVWLAKQEEQLLALKRLKEEKKELVLAEEAIRKEIKETLSDLIVTDEEDPEVKDLVVDKETLSESDASAESSGHDPVETSTKKTTIGDVEELEKLSGKWQSLLEDIHGKMREVKQQMKRHMVKDGPVPSENSDERNTLERQSSILERLSNILKRLLQLVNKVELDANKEYSEIDNPNDYADGTTSSNSHKYGEVVTRKTEMQMEPGSEEKDEDPDARTSSATKTTERYRKFAEILKSLKAERNDGSPVESEDDDTMGEIEKALVAKLRESGIDTQGRKFEVKIITSGFFDEDAEYEATDGDGDDGGEYQTVLIKLMGDDDEAAQNVQQQDRLEKNYRFIWDDDSVTDNDDNNSKEIN